MSTNPDDKTLGDLTPVPSPILSSAQFYIVQGGASHEISMARLASLMTPSGIIADFAALLVPDDWLVCNGTNVSRTTYARLFDAICPIMNVNMTSGNDDVFIPNLPYVTDYRDLFGEDPDWFVEGPNLQPNTRILRVQSNRIEITPTPTATASDVPVRFFPFGRGDGSTTFTLPEGRAEFSRGLDLGRGVDNHRAFGSWQDHAIQNIQGNFRIGRWKDDQHAGVFSGPFREHAVGPNFNAYTGGSNSAAYTDISFNAARSVNTAAESRPRQVAFLRCIKT